VWVEPAPPGVRRSRVLGAHGELSMLLAPQDIRRPRTVLKHRLRQYARELIAEEAQRLAQSFGFVFSTLSVRDQRTRWGSCSGLGHLSFNWRLVMAPPDVMRYVVLHELTHLVEPNHSSRFWRRLAQVCPDLAAQKLWLRRHGAELMRF